MLLSSPHAQLSVVSLLHHFIMLEVALVRRRLSECVHIHLYDVPNVDVFYSV